MSQEISPLEHPNFHRQSMRGAAGIFVSALVWVAIPGLLAHFGYANAILSAVAMGGFILTVLWLMGYLWYRATSAKPDCPKCRTPMDSSGTFSQSKGVSWRVYLCPTCGQNFRVPGLSTQGT